MNFDDAIHRLQAARRDPEQLALATAEIVLAGQDSQLRSAFEAAAVLRWFDAPLLAALLKTSEYDAEYWITSLKMLPMVETFAARRASNVHEATRLAMRRQLARTGHARLCELSARAADCFTESDPLSRIERTYHRLVAVPEAAAGELGNLWQEWHRAGRHEPLQALGIALDDLRRAGILDGGASARALLCISSIRRGRLPLREAEAMTRQALLLFNAAGDPQGEIEAHHQLGSLLRQTGNLSAALASFREQQEIAGEQVRRNPSDRRWQSELSIAHSRIGRVYQAQGFLAQALDEFQAAKDLRQALLADDPDNTDWQRHLSIVQNNLGHVFQVQGRLAQALDEFQAAKDLRQALSAGDPDNTDWQRDLSVAHGNVSRVYQAQGLLTQALKEFQAAKGLMQELVDRDPGNSGWRHDLSAACTCGGRVYQAQGLLAQALDEFKTAKGLRQALVACDPDNTFWQRDLSVAHHKVGGIYQAQGLLAQAFAEYEADLVIAQHLAALDPKNAEWQEHLKTALNNVKGLAAIKSG